MRAAGVGVVQLRDKGGSPAEILGAAAVLADVFAGSDTLLVMNDRADLAALASFPGVHVGQGDLVPKAAWRFAHFVGLSSHTPDQVVQADVEAVDYIAIGPVFSTRTKLDADPVVGLAGVRRARELTARTLVAIGGISRENARAVLDAGANAVAVIGGLFVPGMSVEEVARDFYRILR